MVTLNGFLACDRSVLSTYLVPGSKRSLAVNRDVAPLLIGAAAEWHRRVESIDTGILDDWCYACREIRDGTSLSYHAAGIAIDLNATRHPIGVSIWQTFTPAQITTVRAIAAKYGLRWGGEWSRPDGMHLEVFEQRSVAMERVRRLQATPTWPAFEKDWAWMARAYGAPFLFKVWPTSAIYAYCKQAGVVSLTELGSHGRVPRPTLRSGITRPASALWPHVLYAQRLLNEQLRSLGWSEQWQCGEPDGTFGPRTVTAVTARQRAAGLPQTGVLDVRTWGYMGDAWAGW